MKSMHKLRLVPQPTIDTISLDIELMSTLVNTNDCDRPFTIAVESFGILSFILNESSTENARPKPLKILLNIFKQKL